MELLVGSVLVIIVMELFSFLDSRVNQFDVVKQSLIVGFVPIVYRVNMFDIWAEILIGQTAEPLDDVFGMLCGDIPAA